MHRGTRAGAFRGRLMMMLRRPFRRVAPVVAAVVMATLAVQVPGFAARSPEWRPPSPRDVTGVRLVPVTPTPRPVWTARGREVGGESTVDWPAPGSATVDLTAPGPAVRRAGALPVAITGAGSDAAADMRRAVRRVRVTVHDRDAAARAGVSGVLVSVGRDDGTPTAGASTVEVDYRGFARAYGGDWATRLRLVELPACALTSPTVPGCAQPRPLRSTNRPAAQSVSAEVNLPASGAATLIAVTAGPSGDNGDYTATSLAPSATWQVSQQTGDFSWSLPVRAVPAVGGPEPSLTFAYSSGAIDGRTGGTNTQGSWIGDGWDMWPGYIERQYKSCAEDKDEVDGHAPNNTNVFGGDQCWQGATGNATMSLNGQATELVKSTGNTWKGVADDGSRIELLRDTSLGNTDDDGEHWKVTTVDGTQYFFGRNVGPGGFSGSTATKSTWTSPVYGNHPNEPGYVAGNFASSRKTQAWRWNLDYVVDPHGNTMTLFYERETGAYGREGDANKRTT